jgi:hypothetical protein
MGISNLLYASAVFEEDKHLWNVPAVRPQTLTPQFLSLSSAAQSLHRLRVCGIFACFQMDEQ